MFVHLTVRLTSKLLIFMCLPIKKDGATLGEVIPSKPTIARLSVSFCVSSQS